MKVNINWNKIKNNPQAIEFILWSILLVVDAILNVFQNHGVWWGLCVIATGLTTFFLPKESKVIFGILLMILPIGGILEKRKDLSELKYQSEKSRLEAQKETFIDSTYKTSNANLNCEFEGKYATFAKQKCQAALLALEGKNSKTLNEAKTEKERIRIKNENIDSKIDKLPNSISLLEFFSDPDIFRGLLASVFLPLIQISMSIFTRKEKEEIQVQSAEVANEKQISNAAINSLIELKLKEHKNDVAKVISDLKTEYELKVHRSRIYDVKKRIHKVSEFEIGQNQTKSDTVQTTNGQTAEKVTTIPRQTYVKWQVKNG